MTFGIDRYMSIADIKVNDYFIEERLGSALRLGSQGIRAGRDNLKGHAVVKRVKCS
jgi:hypothetical protein